MLHAMTTSYLLLEVLCLLSFNTFSLSNVVEAQITITSQPVDTSAAPGGTAMFTVVLDNPPGDLIYTWQMGGVGLTDTIKYTGISTDTLTVNNVVESDEGGYTVFLFSPSSNSMFATSTSAMLIVSDTVTSDPAILSIVSPPMITMEPIDQLDVNSATDVMFSVVATGGSLVYQWQKDDVDINDEPFRYSGTETDTLTVFTVTEPDDEGEYRVRVANAAGIVTSFEAFLTIASMCPDLTAPMNGQIVFYTDVLASFHFNTIATYSCDPGFGLDGVDITRICGGDGSSTTGTWSGTAPSCVAIYIYITCPGLTDPTNGEATVYDMSADGSGNYSFGTVATFSCASSFGIVGSTTSTCSGDGSSATEAFDTAVPTCEYKGSVCSRNVSNTPRGMYVWEESEVGINNTIECVFGSLQNMGNASRFCREPSQWDEPGLEVCFTEVTRSFQNINSINITVEVVVEVLTNLSNAVTEALSNEEDQSTLNFDVVVNLLNSTSQLLGTNTNEILDEAAEIMVVTLVLNVVDTITVWPADVINEGSSMMVDSFETILTNVVQRENLTENVTITGTDTAVLALRAEPEMLMNESISFSVTTGSDRDPTITDDKESSAVSIDLPAYLFENVDNQKDVRVVFTYYETGVLFPLAKEDVPNSTVQGTTTVVATSVIGALIASHDKNFTTLRENVTISLPLLQAHELYILSTGRCVSWDFNANGGRGNWTSEGCMINSTDNVNCTITCVCNHLTNFGALVDICPTVGGCQPPSEPQRITLQIVTYVGAGLSIFGLIITIITMVGFKKLRQRDASKYHIQLSLSILLSLIFFLVGIDRVEVKGVCIAMSVLIQYFILVSFMWMAAEALLMFQKLVIVFVNITTRFLVILSLVCWLAPTIPVLIPLPINPIFMITTEKREINASMMSLTNSTEEIIRYCFTGNTGVLYGTFLGPILAIILFNLVVFFCVLVVLVKHTKKTFDRSKETNESRSVVIRFIFSIFGIMSVYGVSWIFGFFVISPDKDINFASQLIFSLLNSLQGFFIFMFFCVLGKDAREAWKELLCRRKVKNVFYPSTSNSQLRNRHSNQYGTGARSGQTLQRALHRDSSMLSDSTSMMSTLERSIFRRETDTSSVISTLDRRALRHGGSTLSSYISRVPSDIEQLGERDQLSQQEQLRLYSLQEGVEDVMEIDGEVEVTETQVHSQDLDVIEQQPPPQASVADAVSVRDKRSSTTSPHSQTESQVGYDLEEIESNNDVFCNPDVDY